MSQPFSTNSGVTITRALPALPAAEFAAQIPEQRIEEKLRQVTMVYKGLKSGLQNVASLSDAEREIVSDSVIYWDEVAEKLLARLEKPE